MYKHILIATDGSELAMKGVKHGLGLAKASGAKATIVTTTEMWAPRQMASEAWRQNFDAVQEFDAAAAKAAKEILDVASKAADQAGVKAELRHVPDTHPAEGILKAAADTGADLIVIASHGRRGLNRMLLGSVAQEVITQSPVPAVIVR